MSENIERDIVGSLQASKSIVIKGGRIIDPLTSRDEITDIYIVNDEIKTIDVGLAQQIPDVEIIDATGLIVVPGFIDLHVHFRDPGQLHKESISSGANAAAAGGFTTVVQMRNTEPPFDSPERIHEINERAKQESIRILTTGTITKGIHGVEAVDVRAMAEAGADIIVCHLGLTTGGSIGAETALKLEQCPSLVDQWAEAALRVNQDIIILVHGGPVSMPDDAQFVLDNTQACHGFYGASSMERLPTEKALKEQTRAFKKLKFK